VEAAKSPLVKPVNGVVNVGGGREKGSEAATNLNPIVPGTGGPTRGIPNHIKAGFEQIAEVFEPGSATVIKSSRLPFHTVDWDAAAKGSNKVMAPGGKLYLNVWVREGVDDPNIMLKAFQAEGFSNLIIISRGTGTILYGIKTVQEPGGKGKAGAQKIETPKSPAASGAGKLQVKTIGPETLAPSQGLRARTILPPGASDITAPVAKVEAGTNVGEPPIVPPAPHAAEAKLPTVSQVRPPAATAAPKPSSVGGVESPISSGPSTSSPKDVILDKLQIPGPPRTTSVQPPAKGGLTAKPLATAELALPSAGVKGDSNPKPKGETRDLAAPPSTRGSVTAYVPSRPPLHIGPSTRARAIESAAEPALQFVHGILDWFAERIEREKAQKALEQEWPNIVMALQETGKGVIIFFEYSQPKPPPDSAVVPGRRFEGIHWQTGGAKQPEPGSLRGRGETAQFTSQYIPPIKEAATRTDKGAAEYRFDQLWQRQKVYQRVGERMAREGRVGRFFRDRKQNQIDLRAVYNALSDLKSARIAIAQNRIKDAQESMDAAEEWLGRMRQTFVEYAGTDVFD
jgi:hypothetical protein